MSGLLAALACSLLAAGPVQAAKGPLVADISSNVIELRHDFAGAELLLFGAIGGEGDAPPDIVLSVVGPDETVVVRRKERVSGLWVNRASWKFRDVPGYFALLSNRPLAEISSGEQLDRLGLLPDSQPILRLPQEEAEKAAPFVEGLRRNMARRGLWYVAEGRALIREESLFRAALPLPSNVPVGHYRVRAHLFRGGDLVAMRELGIEIDKIGFERALFDMSRRRPLLYGFAAVAVALAAGWGASLLTDRRH